MDQISATRIPEWGDDTRIGRSQRSERHNTIRPSRRSVLFGGMALGVSLAATGANLLATVIPASAYRGFRIRGYSEASGEPCSPGGYASDHGCTPGCGPSIVYGDACHTSGRLTGYHRGLLKSWVLASGVWWKLRPSKCISPDSGIDDWENWDGWKWRTYGDCAECTNKYWRCHDGYVDTGEGTNTSICRWCVSYGGNDG